MGQNVKGTNPYPTDINFMNIKCTLKQLNTLLLLVSGVLGLCEALGIGDPAILKFIKTGVDVAKSFLTLVEQPTLEEAE